MYCNILHELGPNPHELRPQRITEQYNIIKIVLLLILLLALGRRIV